MIDDSMKDQFSFMIKIPLGFDTYISPKRRKLYDRHL